MTGASAWGCLTPALPQASDAEGRGRGCSSGPSRLCPGSRELSPPLPYLHPSFPLWAESPATLCRGVAPALPAVSVIYLSSLRSAAPLLPHSPPFPWLPKELPKVRSHLNPLCSNAISKRAIFPPGRGYLHLPLASLPTTPVLPHFLSLCCSRLAPPDTPDPP